MGRRAVAALSERGARNGHLRAVGTCDAVRRPVVEWWDLVTRRASLSMRCALCVAYASRVVSGVCVIAVGPFGLHR